MAEAVRLAGLLDIRTCFGLTADGTMETQRKKVTFSRKLPLRINYDVPSQRVYTIMSFEGFVRTKRVFRSIVMCFVLSGRALLFF